MRNIPTQFFAAGAQILHFGAIVRRPVKRHLGELFFRKRKAETLAEIAKRIFVNLLLLVGDVPTLSGFPEAITFNRAGKDYRR